MGFPRHLRGCRFFRFKQPQIRSTVERHEPALSTTSNADEFLNDGINRLKPGKAAFCDDPVVDTGALLAVRAVFGVSGDLLGPALVIGFPHDVRQFEHLLPQVLDLSGYQQILPTRH
jgi:hypothetical protein